MVHFIDGTRFYAILPIEGCIKRRTSSVCPSVRPYFPCLPFTASGEP